MHYSGPTRSIIDLAGSWSYSADNGRSWSDVAVPSSASYEGRLIFTRKFQADSSMISRGGFKLVAYGINYACEIYINEIYIGKHEGGYTSFSLVVPANTIQVGRENIIRITTDNRLGAKNTIPLRQQIGGFKNYAGILRDIFLVSTPSVWVDQLRVSTESAAAGSVRAVVRATMSGREELASWIGSSCVLSVEVIEKATGASVGRASSGFTPLPNQDATVDLSMTVSAKLWSVDNPELYTVRAVITSSDGRTIDEHQIVTGFRSLDVKKNRILLNGTPITIKGAAWMEDSPYHGASLSYEEMEKDLALIKNLGANTVRFAYHPPHPYVLDLCDQLGLLVMEDLPLLEVPGRIGALDNYRQLAENYLREMIQRDRNHPSVMAWGLGDGVQEEKGGNGITAHLNGVVKSTDRRLTYCTSHYGAESECSGSVDIAAVTISSGDIKEFRAHLEDWIEQHPDQPVVVSRYGKAIETGNRNGYSDPMSQEAQARYLLQRYNAIKDAGIAGGVVWAFNDWRSDRPVLTVKLAIPELMTAGIVEMNREKKIAFDVVRSMYLGEKSAALPIGTASPQSPISYVLVGLLLLIIFAWLINSNRRFRESVIRALFRPYNFFADVRDQRLLSPLHSTLLVMIVSVTFAIIFSSIIYHYRTNPAFDYALTHLLVSDSAKYAAIQLTWNAPFCILAVSVFMFIWFYLVTLVIQAISFFVRARVTLYHSYAISVWSTLPWIIFIPLGMIIFRVMENEAYVVPVLVLTAAIFLWIFLRMLKGLSVIYDMLPAKVYFIAFCVVVCILGGIFLAYDHYFSTAAYIDYFITMVVPSVR